MTRINSTKIGEIEIIALTDGAAQFGAELFPGTEERTITDILKNVGVTTIARVLHLANPEIGIAFDIDMEAARETRKRALDMIATDGMKISGGHFLQPNIGTLAIIMVKV